MRSKSSLAIVLIAAAAISAAIIALTLNAAERVAGQDAAVTGSAAKAGQRAGGASLASSQDSVRAVKTAVAAKGTLRPYVDVGGDVESVINVDIYPDIAGRLVELRVAVGDTVNKGQAIAKVDPSKPGASYALSPVLSPISGTITSTIAQVGETVSASSSVAKVGVMDKLQVKLKLPERDVGKARLGMAAEVSFEAYPGVTFRAAVTRVSPVVDPTSRTKEVILGFAASDERINAGMYAKVKLYSPPLADRIVVPASALVNQNGERFVYVAAAKGDGAVAEKRIVETGSEVDGSVEVGKGLASGERVVIQGQTLLTDGVAIRETNQGAEAR